MGDVTLHNTGNTQSFTLVLIRQGENRPEQMDENPSIHLPLKPHLTDAVPFGSVDCTPRPFVFFSSPGKSIHTCKSLQIRWLPVCALID